MLLRLSIYGQLSCLELQCIFHLVTPSRTLAQKIKLCTTTTDFILRNVIRPKHEYM